jgi:hypothetical protein
MLSTPTNGIQFVEGTEVTLIWEVVAGANSYAVELWPQVGDIQYSGRIVERNWEIGSPAVGSYAWQVEAYNDLEFSGWSEPMWTFSVVPHAPSALQATPLNCNEVSLQWQDNSNQEGGFAIYRDGVMIGQVAADVTTLQDANLVAQQSYAYKVVALYNDLASEASNTSIVETETCSVVPSQSSLHLPAIHP